MTAISNNTYNLSGYNSIYLSNWLYWGDGITSGTSRFNIYVCSTQSSCTSVANVSYDRSSGHNQSKSISANISGYSGNYYIKVTVYQSIYIQSNVGAVILKR